MYNVGSGEEISIKSLSEKIKEIIQYQGEIKWDLSKPDGTPRKLIDSSKINKEGFLPKINLDLGINMTYNWYKQNLKK